MTVNQTPPLIALAFVVVAATVYFSALAWGAPVWRSLPLDSELIRTTLPLLVLYVVPAVGAAGIQFGLTRRVTGSPFWRAIQTTAAAILGPLLGAIFTFFGWLVLGGTM